MLPSWCRATITVERPNHVTQRGSSVPTFDGVTPVTVSGCSVQPGGSSLNVSQARVNATTSLVTVWCPCGTDVQAGDRITIGGTRYAINGIPQVWESPTGAASHVVLDLIAWEG